MVEVDPRYARQALLPELGAAGQSRLAAASVLVIGAGGLASPVLQYLAGAGVGKLTIVDPDSVELSNLHRQPLFSEADIDKPKAVAAQAVLQRLNSGIAITAHVQRLDPANVATLSANADLVLDCADSFAASYIASDHCFAAKLPLISASVLGRQGYVGGFCGAAPAPAPSLRAVFPDLPATLASCATAGVLGPAVGVLGSLQAQLAIAALLELTPSPLGRLISVDLGHYRFGGFRFDQALEPDSSALRFIALSALQPQDYVIDLRGVDEAPQLICASAVRGELAVFQDRRMVPPDGQRAVLCCRSGLRAWRAASALRRYWHGPIALLAAGD